MRTDGADGASRGLLDGAWWPRSRDLLVELPALTRMLDPCGPASRGSPRTSTRTSCCCPTTPVAGTCWSRRPRQGPRLRPGSWRPRPTTTARH
ncbi:DUF5994 family protein [Streptomyces bottropensis]|uniref:DUF5994 family protein n=1 Tax=Streptomyces bottropensis TaxID=42235 RepID=UPI003681753E